MISRELFVSIVDNIRLQLHLDYMYSECLSLLYGVELPSYNNSLLYRSLIDLLRFHFPQGEEYCEFDYYIFFNNCGREEKGGEVLEETSGEFYDRLIKNKKGV